METISFARGNPAVDTLPVESLADCAKAALERDGATALSYGAGAGYEPLRRWVAQRHHVEPERVLLTNGSLQGFVFLATHFLAAGSRRIAVEAPTYDRPLKILAGLGAEIVAVPQDEHGLDVSALERALRAGERPAFLYTIPTFQNPSGRTLPPERRRALVELAAGHDLLVLEDDPYGLIRFEGGPLPTLLELDGSERVAYSSSFSKTIAPGVRVGYLVLPRTLAGAIEALAASTYISPGVLSQATVWEFIRRGNFEPNLERVRRLLGARRDAMLEALEREFPAEVRWNRPEGGYFLWLDLPVSAADLLERATERGVTFVKGADFFPPGGGGERSARLAYSFVSPAEIEAGVSRLAELAAAPSAV
jgi:2-aminoadipate transaminase